MSGSFESVQLNACVHRLGLGLKLNTLIQFKSFGEMKPEPMLTPKEKSLSSTGGSEEV